MTQTKTESSQNQQSEVVQTMGQMIWSQFKTHRLAVISLGLILFFIFISLSAELIEKITGLDPNAQNVAQRYLPPMTIAESPNDEKESAIEKFILADPVMSEQLQKEIVAQGLTSGSEADALYDIGTLPLNEAKEKLKQLQSPYQDRFMNLIHRFSTYHLFGTDELGRDVFIRLIYGTRVSMGVGIMVAIASALIGLLIGSLAGFYGGWIDTVLMRLTDSLLSLPTIPVLIIIAAVDLTKLPFLNYFMTPGYESIIKMFFILCLFSWMQVALLVRGSILTLREREFILAAQTLGASDRTIIIRHMFPNVIGPMLVAISLGVGESILFEAALSFLGLGIMPPTPSWGNMLNNAQELIYQAPALAILPGLLILMTTIAFNFLGEGLENAVDPKSVRR